MKPATALALIALSTGLGACQSVNHDAALAGSEATASAAVHAASYAASLNALGHTYAAMGADELAEEHFLAAVEADPENEDYLANLDDFYREKLGIDPRILYAQSNHPAMAGAVTNDGSAMGN